MYAQIDPTTLQCISQDGLCDLLARVMNRVPGECGMTRAEMDAGAVSAAGRLRSVTLHGILTLAALLLDTVGPDGESGFVFEAGELDLIRGACRETGFSLPARTLH
jgi:hypothetical protein